MVDFQLKDKNRSMNYKEILSEIRAFTLCPELLKPIDDEPNVSDVQIDIDLDDDEELTKQLNSKLFNVLVGCGSSICDSESLKSDEFSSIFSSEEEDEDEFDKIVEQLQNKSNEGNVESRSSMPTLSSLFSCESSTNSSSVDQRRIQVINKDKNKINGKKIKFIQHQSKIKYTFSNESSLRLFDKIIKNNFHQKAKAIGLINGKFSDNCNDLNNCSNNDQNYSEVESESSFNHADESILNNSSNEPKDRDDRNGQDNSNDRNNPKDRVNPNDQYNSNDQDNQATKEINLKKRKTKCKKVQNKFLIKEIRNKNNPKIVKKSKSEIFTLKPTTNSSKLKNFLNSIKSK